MMKGKGTDDYLPWQSHHIIYISAKAVEAISNLTLNGKPMAVRSMSMLSSSNYEPGSSCLNQWDPGRSFMAALGIYDKQYEQSEEFQQELKVKVHELLVEQE
ncbi:hypothetical protein JHK82_044717 [Glycine max]|nr:hypothetical protein JHK86_045112 [Glycine max]KAG4951816.1 hypothetical protein JHK85_045683 [Glycine max]KAG5099665.1 hypothetical protein JHK82_044717 [Glycine max]KAG5108264.1 hypothetical protein JHK84_045171 [Glycine max]